MILQNSVDFFFLTLMDWSQDKDLLSFVRMAAIVFRMFAMTCRANVSCACGVAYRSYLAT